MRKLLAELLALIAVDVLVVGTLALLGCSGDTILWTVTAVNGTLVWNR